MNPKSGLVMLSSLIQLKAITKIKAHLQNLHYFSLRKFKKQAKKPILFFLHDIFCLEV